MLKKAENHYVCDGGTTKPVAFLTTLAAALFEWEWSVGQSVHHFGPAGNIFDFDDAEFSYSAVGLSEMSPQLLNALL